MRASGRLITVYGVKGGVGTTAVAANLGAALSVADEVLLMALPGDAGDDLAIWFAAPDNASAPSIKEILFGHTPELLDAMTQRVGERVFLLRSGRGESRLDPRETRQLLRLACARFPWVVIDAGAWRGGELIDILSVGVEESSVTLLVVDQNPLSLRRARELVVRLKPLGRPLRGVINRLTGTGSPGGPDIEERSEALEGLELLGAIRETREVDEAILKGQPVGWIDNRSLCAAEVLHLAQSLAAYAPAAHHEFQATDSNVFRTPAFREIKRKIHQRFLEHVRERGSAAAPAAAASPQVVRGELRMLLDEERVPDLTPGFREQLLKELVDSVTGLGPLQDLLEDPEITEIMINGPEAIYVEKGGKLARISRSLDGEAELRSLIDRIVAPLGRRVDEASPLVDARLPDGSRVNVIIPPLALVGSCLTIRKFSRRRLTVDDLIASQSLTRNAADFLRACVAGKLNVLISGGTGSGKTTLLNVLSGFIGPDERIVTIEDAAELQLPQAHVVSLESRPANLEGRGAVSIRDLVRNALRMRPDRIVVGEVRGGEALDMLQAMNTGHEGSLSTLHANTPRDALARLETMVLMAGVELPLRAIREQVASAVDIIVQIARLKDGQRRVTRITEMDGLEGDLYRLQDVFAVGRGEGELSPMGLVPRVTEKLAERGQILESVLFT